MAANKLPSWKKAHERDQEEGEGSPLERGQDCTEREPSHMTKGTQRCLSPPIGLGLDVI